MIVVSASMPRSASLYYYSITQDVLGYAPIRAIKSAEAKGIYGQYIGGSLHRFDWGGNYFNSKKDKKRNLFSRP